jgi:hypothetical protein
MNIGPQMLPFQFTAWQSTPCSDPYFVLLVLFTDKVNFNRDSIINFHK